MRHHTKNFQPILLVTIDVRQMINCRKEINYHMYFPTYVFVPTFLKGRLRQKLNLGGGVDCQSLAVLKLPTRTWIQVTLPHPLCCGNREVIDVTFAFSSPYPILRTLIMKYFEGDFFISLFILVNDDSLANSAREIRYR